MTLFIVKACVYKLFNVFVVVVAIVVVIGVVKAIGIEFSFTHRYGLSVLPCY